MENNSSKNMTVKHIKKRKKSLTSQIMSLKMPTAVDKIIEKVPKPEGAVPNFGLPKWKYISLDSKIPLIPGPKDAYNFSRKKIGQKLWLQSKSAEFNLNDPNNYEMEWTYDSLHDEHLARYFSRERNTRRLLKLDFISKEMDAKCSLKDYNAYRKFLRKIHADRINRELKKREKLLDEKRILEFADSAAKREIRRLKEEERKKMVKDKLREELNMKRAKKKQENREKGEKLKKRLESLKLKKEKEKQERILKLRAKTEQARNKRAAITEIQRDKIIKNIIEWARRESDRKRVRQQRLAREAEEKRIAMEENWRRRMEEEELEIARNQSALRFALEEREKNIKKFTKKVEKERNKMQKRCKNYKKYLSCYLARSVSGHVKRSCCKKFTKRRKVNNNNNNNNTNKSSEKKTSTAKMEKFVTVVSAV